MKFILITTMITASLASTAAMAQTLPLQSRSERQVDQINRGFMRQEQQLQQSQQMQFNANQFRTEHQPNAMITGRVAPMGGHFGRR
jgi:hypothetical protein